GCRLIVSLENLDESARPQMLMPFQVMGFDVRLADGSFLGKVVDMLLGPTQNCFIVEKGEDRFLVPDVPTVVRRIEPEEKAIEIDPPEGLLNLRW
ncbi:MAG: hypothetical protein KAX38_06240, partial [Candidatus Krumholzibacteria bacterium]|nr:hypothetical protein [Candidatus Krumholzibacteria bacterium]